MNSLKGMGVVAVLGAIAVAVKLAADVRYFVVVVTIVLLISSTFTYIASRSRSRKDREIAELSGMTQVMTWDGIIPASPGARGARRRRRAALVPVLMVLVLGVGVGYAGWNFVRPEMADAEPRSEATAGPLTTRSPTPEASKQPAPPAKTFFDNFRYRGHDDPALAARGWRARTGAGGPGISGTWQADGISFPRDRTAKGGQALQLRLVTDGTRPGTRQAELSTEADVFFRGTLAARVFFTDKPDARDGDHINQAFCTISARTSARYSELDFEYQPNGGWGAPGPKTDMVAWRSARPGDRATNDYQGSLAGWHIMMMTVTDDKVTFSMDGRTLFTGTGKSVPRAQMHIMFNTWLIDLPFKGARTWHMRVNWVYAKADRVVSVSQVRKAVDQLYAGNVNHVNTMPAS